MVVHLRLEAVVKRFVFVLFQLGAEGPQRLAKLLALGFGPGREIVETVHFLLFELEDLKQG